MVEDGMIMDSFQRIQSHDKSDVSQMIYLT